MRDSDTKKRLDDWWRAERQREQKRRQVYQQDCLEVAATVLKWLLGLIVVAAVYFAIVTWYS